MDWNWYSCPLCGAEWRGPLGWKPDDQNMGQHELNCPDRLAAQARLAALVAGEIPYEAARAADDATYAAERAAAEEDRLRQSDLDWKEMAETELKRIRRNAARRARYAERRAAR